MSFLGWLLCIENFKGTVLTKSQNWATRLFILKKKKKKYALFASFHQKPNNAVHRNLKKATLVGRICLTVEFSLVADWLVGQFWLKENDLRLKHFELTSKSLRLLVSYCFQALARDQVVAVHVDNGFMRKNESRQVEESLKRLGVRLKGNSTLSFLCISRVLIKSLNVAMNNSVHRETSHKQTLSKSQELIL